MKTSIVALIAASLFLVGTYLGVGSAPAAPPRPPQPIAVGIQVSDAGVPTVGDLPLVVPGTPDAFPVTTSQILAVGRRVGQGSLSGTSSPSAAAGPAEVAIGAPTTPAPDPGVQQFYVNTSISPLQFSPAPTPSPKGRVDKKPAPAPQPSGSPGPDEPGVLPRPEPTLSPIPAIMPTPKPKPSPTPTPTPSVTVTVTPPPTSTATPSGSSVSPSPDP